MKKILLIILLLPLISRAQLDVKFEKRFIDVVGKWVVFPMNKDSSYNFGYIYIDVQAGLTLNYEGFFKITKEGTWFPSKPENSMMKYRLQPSGVLVAILPESRFKELRITPEPDWAKYYKTDTLSAKWFYRLGFINNAWSECEKALALLNRAYAKDSTFPGLDVELAYSYNCLHQYDKAIAVLKKSLSKAPDECYLYKELSYAEVYSGDLEKATETSKKGISICEDKPMKAEIAYNLAYQYYKRKDKVNFNTWAAETRKWAVKDDQFMTNIIKMEAELK